MLVQSGPDTESSRSYGWAGRVRAALCHYYFRCWQCGCVVKYCYSFAVLGMFPPFGGGQWMPFTHFGDAYSLRMSSGILSEAWAGQLLSSTPTGLPALRLVSRQLLGVISQTTTSWLIGEVADCILLYFDCGASCCPAQWNKHYVEQRDEGELPCEKGQFWIRAVFPHITCWSSCWTFFFASIANTPLLFLTQSLLKKLWDSNWEFSADDGTFPSV